MQQLILHIWWCSEGQTSSDQLDWGQYVVYTRKQVPSLKEDNQWLYIKMHWLFLLCWFSDCIFILLCCLQYCISSLCLWTRNVSGVGNAFSDSNEVCYIAALIASGNVSPDYNSGLSQLIPPDKCSSIRKISQNFDNIPTRIVLPIHVHILGLFLLAYISFEAWMTYIKLAFFDHFWACWLHVRWIPHWMVEVKARDRWLTTFTSFGAMAVKNTLNLSWMPKTIPKCLVLLIFLFHFGSWFEICEQERWRMWIRKMTRGTVCISCQLCSVSFGRSCSDCGQEHRWFDQSTVLGEFGALEEVLSWADLQEELLPCVVLFGNGSTAWMPFLVTLPDTIWWQGHWPKRCPPSHLSLQSHICRPDQLLFFWVVSVKQSS